MYEKNSQLGKNLNAMGKVIVAFSGGVDSAFVLKRAQQELGSANVLAVVVASELFRKEEFQGAVALAHQIGVPVYETEIKELENEAVAANTPDSWYHSKKMLYSHLNELANKLDYNYVLDGMIMDDLSDFRPGIKARTEAGARSVLQEAKLYKKEIRVLSRQIGLPVWNKPASCSLASRIPYGTRLDKQKINQVNEAEQFITGIGLDMVRVRHHGDVARIEVLPEQMVKALSYSDHIEAKLKSIGFAYSSLDLKGYRTGSMNEVLLEQEENEVS